VTLLDLGPWEIPDAFRSSSAARFGRRLRARQMRDVAAVIVGTEAVARAACRLLHLQPERVRVVRIAPRPGFTLAAAGSKGPIASEDLDRAGLTPGRYLVYSGRYDVRQDLSTLFRALADLAAAGRPQELAVEAPWPPRVLLAGATPDDRASLARAAARVGVGEALAYAPPLPTERLAALLRGSRAPLLPVVSEGAGLAAVESIATGTPVIASAVGALPELVGPAGLLVEPRDPDRMATALRTMWVDDPVHGRLVAMARDRARAERRTWADVADETRRIYAEVGIREA
jgi:glycosyltransferase involved in cell wall biosynthesis